MTWNPLFDTFDLFGFYLPPILPWALLALAPALLIGRLARRFGFASAVWHPPLFEAALYVLTLGAIVLGLSAWSEALT